MVTALTGGKNVALLAEQARTLNPQFVAIADDTQYAALKKALAGTNIRIGAGRSAVMEAASMNTDFTMAAIVGQGTGPGRAESPVPTRRG